MNHENIYNHLAEKFDERYNTGQMADTQSALVKAVIRNKPQRMLEAGCGTGHWLSVLTQYIPQRIGLDLAQPMLAIASEHDPEALLVCADASQLPFETSSFDLILCLNALHHFPDPQRFIECAYACLSSGGILLIVGSDPRGRERDWYVYQYFEGTYQTDLARFPGFPQTLTWMSDQGLIKLEQKKIERIDKRFIGYEILEDPYLQKHMCSQLAMLSPADYQRGLDKINQDIEAAAISNRLLIFRTKFDICLLSGEKP